MVVAQSKRQTNDCCRSSKHPQKLEEEVELLQSDEEQESFLSSCFESDCRDETSRYLMSTQNSRSCCKVTVRLANSERTIAILQGMDSCFFVLFS